MTSQPACRHIREEERWCKTLLKYSTSPFILVNIIITAHRLFLCPGVGNKLRFHTTLRRAKIASCQRSKKSTRRCTARHSTTKNSRRGTVCVCVCVLFYNLTRGRTFRLCGKASSQGFVKVVLVKFAIVWAMQRSKKVKPFNT